MTTPYKADTANATNAKILEMTKIEVLLLLLTIPAPFSIDMHPNRLLGSPRNGIVRWQVPQNDRNSWNPFVIMIVQLLSLHSLQNKCVR